MSLGETEHLRAASLEGYSDSGRGPRFWFSPAKLLSDVTVLCSYSSELAMNEIESQSEVHAHILMTSNTTKLQSGTVSSLYTEYSVFKGASI